MAIRSRLIPSGSQTVGPFFNIGLEHMIDAPRPAAAGLQGMIEIRGRVFDGNGKPVPDALLEFWHPGGLASSAEPASGQTRPANFGRATTQADGSFTLVISKPKAVALNNECTQAPHMVVLVFARGLLRHLISRMYLEDEPGNGADPVLLEVPADRRRTLIAQRDSTRGNAYEWDVVLQGAGETVFFAW
jgi:protocatechuate 3,4-dioxygenase, alpha subunit